MMIPDSKGRLSKALEDLEAFMGEHKDKEGLPGDQLNQADALVKGEAT